MPPPKEHFFNVRTPPGTSVDEVIDALEGLVGIQEIYSVQHHGGFDFQVGVNSVAAVQTLLETGGLRLGTRTVPLVPVARQVASVTCLYLPCYVPDNEVVTGLKSYGTTLRIEEARYKDRPSIRTGTRYIKMDMRLENPLPNFARVGGHRATFEYRGVRRLCHRCNLGHFKAQCDTPHCARCGAFGHRTDTCTEPCRRCGGAHASVDCTARKSYSMAAAMDVDEFPALGTATAAGQTQRRMTTVRPAKRPKPNEDGPEPQVIPEKTLAQAAAITAPTAPAQQQEGRQTDAPTPASMRSGERQEEEGSHGHAAPNHGLRDNGRAAGFSPAVQSPRSPANKTNVASRVRLPRDGALTWDSGGSGSRGRKQSAQDCSVLSWASVDETAAEESCHEDGQGVWKVDRPEARKGSQGERKLSLKERTGPAASTAAHSPWWNKTGDDDVPRGREAPQPTNDQSVSGSVEQEKSSKAPGEGDAPKPTEPPISSQKQPRPEPAPRSSIAGRELNMASNMAKQEGRQAEERRRRRLCWRPRNLQEHRRQTSLNPGSSLSTSAHRHLQNPRNILSSNRCRCRQASAEGGTAGAETLRPPTVELSSSRSGPRARARTRLTGGALNAASKRCDVTPRGACEAARRAVSTRRRRQNSVQASGRRPTTWTQTATSSDRWVRSMFPPPPCVFKAVLADEAPQTD
ncbi:hypothetical protein HPB52_017674 [Rhipicephalus sanguineus]|uniref:CCHC-type domain-containing protein n=1 Tax=Rhipicephalus sanguineus TaxID=34632 RepID=A0A9D4PG01_RHISA|nr:hypothetical protein HPB52_017674 [Rhipicephalus sanguineus]